MKPSLLVAYKMGGLYNRHRRTVTDSSRMKYILLNKSRRAVWNGNYF